MDILGSECKRVVLTIEEEVSPGLVVRREEAVIACLNNEGEWEVISNKPHPPVVPQLVNAVLSAVGL